MKQKILSLLTGLALVWFVIPSSIMAQAPATDNPLPPGAVSDDIEDPYGFKITYDEQVSYFDAVSDCETPSLECLVHNVTRFSAIEWIYNIVGKGHRDSLLSQGPPTDDQYANNAGLVGNLSYMIGAMYARPVASTSTYVADLLNSANIATPAYAQGLGFASLDPILPLWKQFRNLAYLFFVVIFIVIGFLIMFRAKIGGNTAVTAQQAIPHVIVSLLFVTFSYAIAGFLIDMMYVSMILIIGIFDETFGNTNVLNYNILQLLGILWHAGPANVGQNVDIASMFIEGFSGGSNFGTTVASILGGLTLTLLLAVAVLIGTVRLFFELLKSYASIILSVVTSPIQLMIGALPGKNVFGPWVKDLIGNLIPFPVVLMAVIMFYQFTDEGLRGHGGFNPPFLLNNADAGALTSLMGLAIILSLPDIVKKFKEPLVNKGFGQWLADTAMKNAKSAEASIPPILASPAAAAGAARGIYAAYDQGERNILQLGRAALGGADIPGRGRVGGAGRWGRTVLRAGNHVRVQLDRLREGRWAQAEDTDKLLAKLVESGQRSKAEETDSKDKGTEPDRAEIG